MAAYEDTIRLLGHSSDRVLIRGHQAHLWSAEVDRLRLAALQRFQAALHRIPLPPAPGRDSTVLGEHVNADIKARSKRTNHQRHAHMEQARYQPVMARTSLRIPPAGCPRPLACLGGYSGLAGHAAHAVRS